MLDLLQQIPGPWFLLYFGVFCAVWITLVRLWDRADGTTDGPLPDPTRFDPLAVSFLRGGAAAVLQTVVFRLWDRDLIEVEGEGSSTTVRRGTAPFGGPSPSLEEQVWEQLATPCTLGSLLASPQLTEAAARQMAPVEQEMRQLRLLCTDDDRKRSWLAFGAGALPLLLVGGAKFWLGVERNRPIGLLALEIVAALLILGAVVKPGRRLTHLGEAFLAQLKTHFDWLGQAVKKTQAVQGIDPAFALAIFGASVLAGSATYAPLNKAFQVLDSGGSGSGGCGGGGCGGGGCGGGCGGCGG